MSRTEDLILLVCNMWSSWHFCVTDCVSGGVERGCGKAGA